MRAATEDYVRVAEFRSSLRRFLRRAEKISRSAGLTPQRYLLLLMDKGAPGGSEQSTVTELVGRAADAGLLRRDPSGEDGRVAHVRLTEEGERRLAQAFSDLESEREELRHALAQLTA